MKLPSFSKLLIAALSASFPLGHAAPANSRNEITPRQGLNLGGLLGGGLLGGILPGLGGTQRTKSDTTNDDAQHASPLNARNEITPRQDLNLPGLLGGLLPGLGGKQRTKSDTANDNAQNFSPLNNRHEITPRQGLNLGGLLGGGLLGGLLPGLGGTQRTQVDATYDTKGSPCQMMLYEENDWKGEYYWGDFYGGRCGTCFPEPPGDRNWLMKSAATLPEEWLNRVRSMKLDGEDCECRLHEYVLPIFQSP